MSKDSRTIPPVLRGVRRVAVMVTIGAVAVAAAIGIFVVVSGEFDDTTGKILLTAGFVAAFAATALCHLAVATRPVRFVGFVGLAAGVVALFFALVITWVDWGSNWDAQAGWGKGFGTSALLAVFLAQVNLLLLLSGRKNPAVRWSLYVTFFAIAAVYGLLLAPILTDGEFPPADASDAYWRIFGVFAILDALGTVVLPVLGTVLKRRETDTHRLTLDLPLGVYSRLAERAASEGRRIDDLAIEQLSDQKLRPQTRRGQKS